jgi:Fur family ferric uptake transcriptional regulator
VAEGRAIVSGVPGPSASHAWVEQTLASLRVRGHRDGGARRAVIELLGEQACCLTAQEIFDQLRALGRRVGIASVYRALEQLTRDGYLQRVELGTDSARFEPLLAGGEHHHHLVCDDCGKIEAFADDDLERALTKLERRTGYAVEAHDVVLHGACRECAPSRSR